jgi:hypothetical protein
VLGEVCFSSRWLAVDPKLAVFTALQVLERNSVLDPPASPFCWANIAGILVEVVATQRVE